MKINQWLAESTTPLRGADISSTQLDAQLILSATLYQSREYLLAHSDQELSDIELSQADKWLQRRVNREPIAYILGHKEFYGRDFMVSPDVLIPRPESEAIIETLKDLQPETIIDIGTGSGCLAIISKLEFPNSQVIATDIDENALKIAKSNAKKHKVEIEFIKSDLLNFPPSIVKRLTSNVHRPASIIANLPYVPNNLITSPEIEKEPDIALFSGKDGLDHYREFWQQVAKIKSKPSFILTESLESQHGQLEFLAQNAGYSLEKTDVCVQLYKSSL